jgi:hypothetical protein
VADYDTSKRAGLGNRGAVTIELTEASKRLLAEFPAKSQAALLTAYRRAGSSATRKMRAEANRQVRQTRVIKHAKLAQLIMARVQPGATIEGSAFSVTVDGSPIPVSKLPHRQLKMGVRFMVRKGQPSKIRGAFVATLKSGHVGVFKRKDKERLPVDAMFTTGIASTFKDDGPREAVEQAGAREFESTLLRNLKL